MNQILHLDNAIHAASSEMCRLRKERAQLIVSLAPHQPEDIFTENGRTYKVRRITASSSRPVAIAECFYQIAGGKWSKGTKPVFFTVGEVHDQG